MFKFSETANYMMPAHFGGDEGPPKSQAYHDITTIRITYETDREMLAQYVPDTFQLSQPLLNVNYAVNRAVDWMAGGSYKIVCVQTPVVYRHGSERLEGWYALVVWESKATPILLGREQTGIPKIFADIEDHHQFGERYFTNASFEGRNFLAIDFRRRAAMTSAELDQANARGGRLNWFGWRYIPNIGRSGAALSHATLYPVDLTYTAGWRGEGAVRWEVLMQEQNPTQAHIIRALAELPIRSYADCMMTCGSQVLRIDIARQLS